MLNNLNNLSNPFVINSLLSFCDSSIAVIVDCKSACKDKSACGLKFESELELEVVLSLSTRRSKTWANLERVFSFRCSTPTIMLALSSAFCWRADSSSSVIFCFDLISAMISALFFLSWRNLSLLSCLRLWWRWN